MFPTVVMLLILALPILAGNRETGFLDREVTIGAERYRYQVFVPWNWTKQKKWPVVLFLHGAGERGDDGLLQTDVGLGRAIRRNPERFPCVAVFPQCRKNRWWTEPEMEAVALRTLEAAAKEFNGDRARVYLTGLSMGGYGSWSLAKKHPSRFAALAVICGGIRPPSAIRTSPAPESAADPYAETARAVGATPVWIFHGAADPVVPVAESQKMAEALKAAGGIVKYTEYEGVGHNSWDRAYGEEEFASWLLSHRLTKESKR